MLFIYLDTSTMNQYVTRNPGRVDRKVAHLILKTGLDQEPSVPE